MHEVVEECIHFRHVPGIRLRITHPGAIRTRVEIAPQEDALMFTLCDTFGQDLPYVLLKLYVTRRCLMHIKNLHSLPIMQFRFYP